MEQHVVKEEKKRKKPSLELWSSETILEFDDSVEALAELKHSHSSS